VATSKHLSASLRMIYWLLASTTVLAACSSLRLSDSPVPSPRYVSSSGDDTSSGTSAQPWRTIQHAADVMGPAQTVIVLTGDYPERVQVTRSGASGSPITFRAQGAVTMRGFTVKADYISILGFDISNTPDNWQDGWGIFLKGNHCTIEDNYVHFATRGGIVLFAAAGSYSSTSDCVVRGNRLHRNALVGIDVSGRDHLVEGNEVWGTIQYHPNWSNPPGWVDADGMRFFGSGHTIRKNYIHDISYDDPENINPHIDCFQTWSDADHEAASDVILEQNRCEVLTSQAPNESGHGFMLADASNLIIRNSIIQAFGGVNTGGGGNRDLMVVNNVFASDLSFPLDRYPCGICIDNAPNTLVMNNILYNQPAHPVYLTGTPQQAMDVGYNLVYRSDGQSPWGSPHPGDIWQTDPRFVNPAQNDFHLKSDSPAIDAGIELVSVVNDFEGNPRPRGPRNDIGAFEWAP